MKSRAVAAGPQPLESAQPTPAAIAWRMMSTVALVSLFAFFAALHLQKWRATGEATGLGLVGEEALAAGLFLFRRTPRRVSGSPRDWLLAAGGSWLIMTARPTGHPLFGLDALATGIQLAGLAGVAITLSTLGRSFGIVAADRGVRTGGPYAIIRHPAYFFYLVTQIGYALQNPSFWNLAVISTVTLCQVGRIGAEEAVLCNSPGYCTYAGRVRFRLFPGVY